MVKTKRRIQPVCVQIPLIDLQIGVFGAFFHSLPQKARADLTGESLPAVLFLNVDGVNSDIIAVQDSKPRSD